MLGQFLRRDVSKRGARVPLTGAAKMGGHTGEERQAWEEGVWVKELAVVQNRILLKAGQWKGAFCKTFLPVKGKKPSGEVSGTLGSPMAFSLLASLPICSILRGTSLLLCHLG